MVELRKKKLNQFLMSNTSNVYNLRVFCHLKSLWIVFCFSDFGANVFKTIFKKVLKIFKTTCSNILCITNISRPKCFQLY